MDRGAWRVRISIYQGQMDMTFPIKVVKIELLATIGGHINWKVKVSVALLLLLLLLRCFSCVQLCETP